MKELLETAFMIMSCGCFDDDVADFKRFSTVITPFNLSIVCLENEGFRHNLDFDKTI